MYNCYFNANNSFSFLLIIHIYFNIKTRYLKYNQRFCIYTVKLFMVFKYLMCALFANVQLASQSAIFCIPSCFEKGLQDISFQLHHLSSNNSQLEAWHIKDKIKSGPHFSPPWHFCLLLNKLSKFNEVA